MNKQSIFPAGVLLLTTVGLAAPAAAAGFYADAPPRDLAMCVAEVRAQADLSNAARVRYDVVSTTRRPVGYAIEIDATVYGQAGGAVLRRYETVCVATGGRKPSRFRIDEKG
jgi:hypothetical protein